MRVDGCEVCGCVSGVVGVDGGDIPSTAGTVLTNLHFVVLLDSMMLNIIVLHRVTLNIVN